jgi:hypothetical protein
MKERRPSISKHQNQPKRSLLPSWFPGRKGQRLGTPSERKLLTRIKIRDYSNPMDDSWIFEVIEKRKPVALNGSPLYWFTPEEIEVYDFRFETKFVDCREEEAIKVPVF